MVVRRQPSSWRNSTPLTLLGPSVSNASGRTFTFVVDQRTFPPSWWHHSLQCNLLSLMLDGGMCGRQCLWRWHSMWCSFLVAMEWGSAHPVVFRRCATVLADPERMACLLWSALAIWCHWVCNVIWIGQRPACTRGHAYLLRQPVCHKGTGAVHRGWCRDKDPQQLWLPRCRAGSTCRWLGWVQRISRSERRWVMVPQLVVHPGAMPCPAPWWWSPEM